MNAITRRPTGMPCSRNRDPACLGHGELAAPGVYLSRL